MLIKGLKKVVNVKFSKHASYKTSTVSWKSREITFQQYRGKSCKTRFSDELNIHEHKRYYYTFDNSLLFTETSEHYTKSSTLNHNVRFLPYQHRGVGIMQYVYALNPVCIVGIPETLPQRSFPVRAVDLRLIQEYNDDSSHLTHTVININNMKFQLIV